VNIYRAPEVVLDHELVVSNEQESKSQWVTLALLV